MSVVVFKDKQADWKNKILKQQNSGQTVTQWCQEHKINTRTFYKWRLKIFPKTLNRDNFTEIKNTSDSGISLEFKGIHLNLAKNFDQKSLKDFLVVLQEVNQ